MAIEQQAIFAPLIRKLGKGAPLNAADQDAIMALPYRAAVIEAGDYIVRDGGRPDGCCALLSGYAYRHKILGNGSRQIMSLHFRGDMVDVHNAHSGSPTTMFRR
jgi:CRP-like cAMP-binding protein